jgi:hypothetical protein
MEAQEGATDRDSLSIVLDLQQLESPVLHRNTDHRGACIKTNGDVGDDVRAW